ncbi:hypothetical protein [Oceanospirillum linum]|uniref:Uncharacterized protein n=1 Tax=Oceanospirillum linum TaxID=966 RepID=A0A1T1HAD1_OCELI|nr:hypothetical protein [Oceanospirillum linum]OOV86687.1 hypothetical protein BTA35_0212490 [Oceanospirillum linum]SEG26195.1 hypothetical protein SAMN04489856_10747 [Oleiphilus messinensis]SMP27856.1 hypothetical protein SAMN06264348_106170 [Oceanospirillum linum]
MVLSTLALVGIIQLFLLLAGGIFFLFLHTRFLKKQIRILRGEDQNETDTVPPPVAAMTESHESGSSISTEEGHDSLALDPEEAIQPSASLEASADPSPQMEGAGFIPVSPSLSEEDSVKVTGEISELRNMLNEKLLLTANLRKLIEGLLENPASAESTVDIAEQQNSSLLDLEEYIKLSRKEAAAVEEKITHYRDQLTKAKVLLSRYKEQHEQDIKQLKEEHSALIGQSEETTSQEEPETAHTSEPEEQVHQEPHPQTDKPE